MAPPPTWSLRLKRFTFGDGSCHDRGCRGSKGWNCDADGHHAGERENYRTMHLCFSRSMKGDGLRYCGKFPEDKHDIERLEAVDLGHE